MSQDFSREILLQIQEQQTKDAQTLGRILGSLEGYNSRVEKLESAQTRNWWMTVGIAPVLALAHGIARKFGVAI